MTVGDVGDGVLDVPVERELPELEGWVQLRQDPVGDGLRLAVYPSASGRLFFALVSSSRQGIRPFVGSPGGLVGERPGRGAPAPSQTIPRAARIGLRTSETPRTFPIA